MSVRYGQCTIDPLTATVAISGLEARSTDEAGHHLSLDSLEVRLRPLQALAGGLQVERLKVAGLKVDWTRPPGGPAPAPRHSSSGCWDRPLKLIHLEALQVSDADIQFDLPGGRISLKGAEVTSILSRGTYHLDARASGKASLPGRDPLDVSSMSIGADLDVPHDRVRIRSAGLAIGDVRATVSGVLEGLCKPEPDLEGDLHAPLAQLLPLLGVKLANPQGTVDFRGGWRHASSSSLIGAVSGELKLQGVAFAAYKVPSLMLTVSGDEKQLKIDSLHVDLDPEATADISGSLGLTGKLPLELEVQVKNGPLARILDAADITHSWADFRGTVDGHLQGRLAPPLLVTGTVQGDISNFTVDDSGWDVEGPKQRLLTVHPKVHVQTDLRIDKEALHFEHGKLTSPLSEALVDATMNYDNRKGLKIAVQLPHVELSELMQIAGNDWDGRGSVSATLEGPYASVQIAGRVAFDDFQLLDVDFGSVLGPISADTSAGMLRFPHLACQKGSTSYAAAGSLDLNHQANLDIHLDVERGGRVIDLLSALEKLQPLVTDLKQDLGGEFFGSADLHGPANHLGATANLSLPKLTVFDRPFRNGVLKGGLHDGRDFVIDSFRSDEAEGSLSAHGTVTVDGAVALAVEGQRLSVEKLLWMDAAPSATGLLSVVGRIDGRLNAPLPSGEFKIDDLTAFDIPLGTSQGRFSTAGQTISLKGRGGDEVLVEGSAELSGRGSYRAQFEGRTKHLERYLSSRFDQPIGGEVTGQLAISGALLDAEKSRGAFDLSHLTIVDQRLRLDNTGPIRIGVDAGALSIGSTPLSAGAGGKVVVEGQVRGDGTLEGTLKGDLDGRLLDGLVPKIERLSGRVSAQASVRGNKETPEVVGSMTIGSGGFSWSGLPLVFSHVHGTAEFSQHKVLFSEMAGDLNGGPATVSGEVQLRGFVFANYNLNAELKNVPLRIPDSIPSQVSGTLQLTGDPDRDLKMAGKLEVLSARYARDFDIDSTIESFASKKSGGFEVEGDDAAGPAMQYDILLHSGNDVRVENDVAHLKLDGSLRLKGTVVSPGLLGSVVARNGTVDFRGYRYHVSQATFSFTSAEEIAPEFDVAADTDARDHRVFVHVYGTPKSYRLQLSSQPALSQEDIAKLLTIGVTSQDAVATTGLGNAGYGADVLWNITGLHDQVRRLLPRNDLIKDLSISPGSAFIEATGQVEPVVRIETRFLTDRFKLSAQLPLAETAGKRIQGEYLLNDHLSLQGEWDNDYTDYSFGNFGADFRVRWELGE